MSDVTRRRFGIGLLVAGLVIGLVHFGVVPLPDGGRIRTTGGPLAIAVVLESKDATPAVGLTIVGLRDGDNAKAIAAKGHTVDVIDDDETNAAGEPSERLKHWLPIVSTAPRPTLAITDQRGKVLAVEKLPATVTGVMDVVRRVGG